MQSLTMRGAGLIGLIYLGILALPTSIQDRIIFPGAATQGSPQAHYEPGPGAESLRLETPGKGRVAAIYGGATLPDGRPDPRAGSRPALLFFYGNAMCTAYALPEFERFRRLGFNVLIPDYLGYGLSDGRASELGCRETAEAAYEELLRRGFPAPRIVSAGWSLGGAVAIDLASRRPVGGLIAFSTFTSAQDMARNLLPIPLPGWFFAHKFESLAKLPTVRCPILLGHGRRDAIVPFAMFERLAAAAKGPLTTVVIDDAEHNDFFDVGGRRIDEAMRRLADAMPR